MENVGIRSRKDDVETVVSNQYLTFLLAEEIFALDIRCVREIIQYGEMNSVPRMPEFVRGVINLRGSVVAVVDMRSRFGWGVSEIGKKTCIIIVELVHDGERSEIGLMVDAVSEVVDIDSTNVETPPQFGSAIRREYIQHIGKVNGRFVVILDAMHALNIDEMGHLVAQMHGV